MSKINTFFNFIKNANKVSSLPADRKQEILANTQHLNAETLMGRLTNRYHDDFLDELFTRRITSALIEDNCGFRSWKYHQEFLHNTLFTDDYTGFNEWVMTAYSHYLWCAYDPNGSYVGDTDIYASHAVACMFLDFTLVDFLVEGSGNSELRSMANKMGYRHWALHEDGFICVANDIIRKWRLAITRKYPTIKPVNLAAYITDPDNRVHPFDLDAYLKLAELEALLKSE